MGRRRSNRAESGLIDDVGELLGQAALAGPIGMAGVGTLFLVLGLWLRGERHEFLQELNVWIATAMAWFGVALVLAGGIWAWAKWGRRIGDPATSGVVGFPDVAPSAKSSPRDGAAFERQVADAFRRQGYEVEETGTHGTGGDAGIDLVLRRPADPAAATVLVQCKDYAAWAVGVEKVRAFGGAVAMRGPGHVGLIVTTSRFTADAQRDAKALGIRLIDGEQWQSMVRKAGVPAREGVSAAALVLQDPPAPVRAEGPVCPNCRVPMVRREPRPGRDSWQPFWGCRNYPRCRQTVKAS